MRKERLEATKKYMKLSANKRVALMAMLGVWGKGIPLSHSIETLLVHLETVQ